ncbi:MULTISPECIES: antibiotic biosynthesis monooxygenase family protein [unclassified Streptomyces]|uniref:antibiotic biosynthesis monooxygenase family protein n=1 Tax=unclassified Streptomyces TaxID=2593676 RepID=UPI002877D369|nr:antibiotic biosynthesis monooxygenase family protein [Streptomyces sp. BB1-1-1]WND35034.1 antibiotic biosynthesis monooxygenase family protein [Streptomyces sp. BB1-1-1]
MQPNDLDPTGSGVVTFINRFTVHASPEEFEKAFAETGRYLAGRDGFLRYVLHQHAEDPDRWVNIAHWRDAHAFRAAVGDPSFRQHASAVRRLSASEPGLYVPRQHVSGEWAATEDR